MPGHANIAHFTINAPNNASYNINAQEAYFSYKCPHCDTHTSGAVIASFPADLKQPIEVKWLRCSSCNYGAVLNRQELAPGSKEGESVEGLPDDTKAAYTEARTNASIGSYTSCELMCRKILMHVAVDKGANPGESFAHYLTYLESSGYVTPPMKPWVDQIRKNGNIATHELPATDRERAIDTLSFTTQLLRAIYEMAYRFQQSTQRSSPESQ